ncbi:sulfotransferase domain-containing protein [Winogradskyella sp. F6397]|uniref:Sulfotransferase domain-containing protein n=1 Tax=Winogradskyella marina TaxID=2785530 RepID=A0ABS0EKJ2_9FLAO|nr:sulfotransferase domain-containing protein [Winogradskyella marina]MBF8150974.1 sulfotransferase domain-containing protein [Winogradskyella marina]
MKTITGIHGVPRSGTSWLAQIFNASPEVRLKFQPLFSYAFKERLDEFSSSKDITDFFDGIYNSDDDFINMRDTDLLKGYPQFKKMEEQQHLVFKHVRYHNVLPNLMKNHSYLKLILVIRNPLAVLSSWKNAPREFDKSWDFLKEWKLAQLKNTDRADYFGFDKWKVVTEMFLSLEKSYPKRVKLVTYKSMLSNTLEVSEELYKFAGITFGEQSKNFIEESKTKQVNHPNSVFRVKINDEAYKNDISIDIQDEIIQNLKGTNLERFLYE